MLISFLRQSLPDILYFSAYTLWSRKTSI